jgi:hypothetical protein
VNVFHLPRWRGIVGVCVAFVALAADAQSWSRDWGLLGSVPGYLAERIVPAGAGEFLIAGNGSFASASTPLQRVRADGSTRWLSVLHGDGYASVDAVIADTDGSALVLSPNGGSSDAMVARIGEDGVLDWVRRLPARHMVAMDADRIALFGCDAESGILTTLARADGRVIDQRVMPMGDDDPWCYTAGLDTDGAGGVVVASVPSPSWQVLAMRIAADGTTTWSTSVAQVSQMAAVRGNTVYFTSDDRLQAITLSSGLPAWSSECASSTPLRFVDDDPLCELPDGRVARLRAATGQVAWTSESGLGVAVAVVGGDVWFARGESLARVRGNDGALLWSAVTGTAHAPHYVYLAGAADDLVRVAMPTLYPGEPSRLERYARADGAALGTYPIERVVAGVRSFEARRDGDDVFSLGFGDDMRLRRLSAVDGAVIWEVRLDELPNAFPSFIISDSAIVVAYSTESTHLWHVDRVSGAVQWRATLDANAGFIRRSQSAPAFALDGGVYVATSYFEGDAQSLAVRDFVYKLAASDGSVVWRRDMLNAPSIGVPYESPRIAAVGGGVVVGLGRSDSRDPAGLYRLADADGATAWTASALGLDASAHYMRGNDGAVYGVGANAANDALFTKIDPATGAVDWQRAYHADGAPFGTYYDDSVFVLPGGDVVFGGVSGPEDGPWTSRLLRVAADGSGIERLWDRGGMSSSRMLVRGIDEDGRGWGDDTYGMLHVLRQFDFARRKFIAYRVLGPYRSHELDDRTKYEQVDIPVDGRMAANVSVLPVGTMPTSRIDMLDLNNPVRGDLAVTMSSFAADTPYGANVPFTIGARYAGDTPLAGVRVLARLPWSGTPSSLACTGQGVANCVVAERGDWIDARMELTPGASVEIAGTIRALSFVPSRWRPTLSYEAAVFGPWWFEEANIDNNLSNGDALFLGDFD